MAEPIPRSLMCTHRDRLNFTGGMFLVSLADIIYKKTFIFLISVQWLSVKRWVVALSFPYWQNSQLTMDSEPIDYSDLAVQGPAVGNAGVGADQGH